MDFLKLLHSNHMKIYRMCNSVEGAGARCAKSAVLHTLTISTTTSAAAGNLHSISSCKAEKVLKGSNYDGMAGSAPILSGRPNYVQTES